MVNSPGLRKIPRADTSVQYTNRAYKNDGEEMKPNYHKAGSSQKISYDLANGQHLSITVSGKPNDNSLNNDNSKNSDAVSFMALFRFADKWDKLLMIMGTICAAIHGICMPLFILVFGGVIDAFLQSTPASMAADTNETTTSHVSPTTVAAMQQLCLFYVYIGIAVLISAYGQVTFWVLAAERQCHKMRLAFLRSVLYQNMGWYDLQQAGELNTRLTDDINKIQGGIGDKLGILIHWGVVGIAALVLGLIKGWKLSLVIMCLTPLQSFGAFMMSKILSSFTTTERSAYAKAGVIAEEVLGGVRTVVAYGGEKKEAKRYESRLHEAFRAGLKKAFISGIGMGIMWSMIFSSYCLGFWYGSKLVREGLASCRSQCEADQLMYNSTSSVSICNCDDMEYTPGILIIVFFSNIFAGFGIGNSLPNLATLATARGAAKFIFDVIDRKSEIDASRPEGIVVRDGEDFGKITFKDVHFEYPSRPDVEILRGLNLEISSGQRVAVVGGSGGGKSTVVQLIQRFYDATSGVVLIGERDIREMKLSWLRSKIGVVGQEPVLFDGTIAENISYGRLDVTPQEIEEAAKNSNAHDFIMKLPEQYDTYIGNRGAQLSGGQKQRIAIARAMVRNPVIVLLDEATSALDTESESIVQAALDRASEGRTTIIVAHRLSTIKNADKIVVLADGQVAEMGTHNELLQLDGIYKNMVMTQTVEENVNRVLKPIPVVEEEDLLESVNKSYQRDYFSQRSLSIRSINSRLGVEIEDVKQKAPDVPLHRIIALNQKEWPYIVIGCLAAFANGGVIPGFALVFGDMLGVFQNPDLKKQESDSLFYSLMFLVVGAVAFLTMFLQNFMFGISGEYLTRRLQSQAFAAMLKQEMGWFDDPKNSTGSLTTRLAMDASSVQGATGSRLGIQLQTVGGILIGIGLAFAFGWKLTLVVLAFVPLLIFAGIGRAKLMSGFNTSTKEGLVSGGKIAAEGIESIRTVVSLGREELIYEKYDAVITPPHKKELKQAHIEGLMFSVAQATTFFAYATAFYFGSWWVDSGDMSFPDVMKVFSSVIWAAMTAGQASAFAGDYTKAKSAANEIFALFDRKPTINAWDNDEGKKLEGVKGGIQFQNINFHYPTRPGVKVLRGLNLELKPGKTVALVGTSGCGKSTCIQLVERFYEATEGTLLFEGVPCKNLCVSWLRAQLGLVQQEPILFDRSIAENIAYGDNSREVTMAEIIEAAKLANAHNFISGLPSGYETRAGAKGTQLSGGQKQRIAIARALVRQPKILLLDEATSALDSESEKIVQEALDRARENRTCLVIAHRLSTVQNADYIAVIDRGQVVEIGTHTELLDKKEMYYKLCNAQSLVY